MKYIDIAKLLTDGGVGLLPSDTIYGLSCRALDQKAVERIYKLKGRDYSKPFIILLADAAQARELHIDPKLLEPAEAHWPAPLSVIVPAPNAPAWLIRGQATLALRVPADAGLHKLLKGTGPLVSTSANPQNLPPATTAKEAKAYFGDKLDFYVDKGRLTNQPSTVATLKNGRLKIVRPGGYDLKLSGGAGK